MDRRDREHPNDVVDGRSNIIVRRNYDKTKPSQSSLSVTSKMAECDVDQVKRRKLTNDNMPPAAVNGMSSYQSVQPSIETRNMFESLSDLAANDDSAENVESNAAAKKTKASRLPPISIINKGTRQTRELLNLANIPQTSYHMKAVKSGTQLMVKGESCFTAAIQALKESNTEYFTYTPSSKQPVRIIISGLSLYPLPELMDELVANGVRPLDLKIFSQKKGGPEDDVLYLLYFEKNSVKLSELQRVKTLFNVVVYWRFFSRRAVDVVQCHRCQKFGHSHRNCNIAPLCVKCGEKHLTADCRLPKKAALRDGNDTRERIRCANCSGNHTANFHGCPSRKDYIKKMESIRQRARAKPSPFSRSSRVSNNVVPRSSIIPTSNQATAGVNTYSQVLQGRRPPPSESPSPGLFTVSEFLCLAEDLFTRLESCRNKREQFQALHELAVKYIYNG